MTTTEFTPREGSPCHKAMQAIRAHGHRLSREALAVALDVGEEEIDGLLGYPLRVGALSRDEEAGIVWFDIGDGKTASAPIRRATHSSMPGWAPVPGSNAAKALVALKGKGWVRAKELGVLIGASQTSLPGSLARSLEVGLIESDTIGPNRYYFLPSERDATPATAPAPDVSQETAEEPAKPADTPKSEWAIPRIADLLAAAARTPEAPPVPATLPLPPVPAPAPPPKPVELSPESSTEHFDCALYSGGRFVIEIGEQVITLSKRHTIRLINYIDRLATEES
jgi:hypothetical protein